MLFAGVVPCDVAMVLWLPRAVAGVACRRFDAVARCNMPPSRRAPGYVGWRDRVGAGGPSRRREFWHFADTPSPSLLKQLNDGLADGQAGILVPGSGLGRLAMELAASGCGLTIQLTGTATTPIPASFIRRRRDCHFADIPSPTFVSIGMERECHQNDIIADGYHSHAESRNLDSAINIQLPC